MRTMTLSVGALCVTALAPLLWAPEASAGYRSTMEQTVYGMDCAPCAYGVANRLESFEGVKDVDLDLNTGKAVMTLAAENEVTLAAVRDTIIRGGFTPRESRVEAIGTVEIHEDGKRVFETRETGERFVLRPAEVHEDVENADAMEQAWEELLALSGDKPVRVRGFVAPQDEDKPAEVLPMYLHGIAEGDREADTAEEG